MIKLLKTDSDGLMMVGLPKTSEIIVQLISKKTGKDFATVLSTAIEYLATRVLNDNEKAILIEKLKQI
jgi:hypothetical protein